MKFVAYYFTIDEKDFIYIINYFLKVREAKYFVNLNEWLCSEKCACPGFISKSNLEEKGIYFSLQCQVTVSGEVTEAGT